MKLADLLKTVAPAQQPVAAASRVDKTVHDVFREWALATPRATAVSASDESLTYAELDRQSDLLAHELVEQYAVQPEDLIPILMERSPRIIVAMLAILKAGAAYVPILPTDPADRIKFILRDTKCRVVITEAGSRALVSASADPSVAICLLDQAPHDTGKTPVLPKSCGASRLAYAMYTSGTSGRPKGVLIEHRGIVRLVVGANYIKITPDDRFLQAGSLAFDAATFEIWGALLNGASVRLLRREEVLDPDRFAALLRRRECTVLFLTTALFNRFAQSNPAIFGRLDVLLFGGEAVDARRVAAVLDHGKPGRLLHVYGPTESTTFASWYEVTTLASDAVTVPIGVPLANTSLYLLDGRKQLVPVGVPGELYIGGGGLARGYLNRPELTAASFITVEGLGRLYRTGDLCRWRRDGALEFLGRRDDQVKIRGFRIELGEIEARLREVAGIRDAAIVTRDGPDGEKSLVAYVAGDADLDASALRALCKETLPHYMVPADFVVLGHLPLNANGKVDRRALRLPARAAAKPASVATEDASATLQQLRRIWEEILGRSDFRADENFFDLGGHSLTAMQMVSFVELRMKAVLPINVVFDAPTLQALAQYLLDSARFGVAALDDGMVLMDGDPAQGAVFAFPPATADCLGYRELARSLRPLGFYGFTFIESEDRIRQYAILIQESTAAEPYFLFGYSSGGNLAYHVAQEIERRGGTVAAVILLDSVRRLRELGISPQQMNQIADEFLSDERARVYLTSSVLREKTQRNIVRNLTYISSCLDTHTINADIHLIVAEDQRNGQNGSNAELITSKMAWEAATTGRFFWHLGAGEHNQMLHEPAIAKNTAILKELLRVGPAVKANNS